MAERSVLKENQVILVSDDRGDVASHNTEGHGLYWRDTRFLSLYELTVEGAKPTLLAAAGEHNFMNNFQFANIALETAEGVQLPARTISIRRNRFLHNGLHERFGLLNYNQFPVRVRLTISVGSDFRDMFDVRGYTTRSSHGTIDPPKIEGGRLTLSYLGLDKVRRETEVRFEPLPHAVDLVIADASNQVEIRSLPGLSGHGDPRTEFSVIPPSADVHFELTLPPKESRSVTLTVVPAVDGQHPDREQGELSLDAQFLLIRDSYRKWESDCAEIETDHEILNAIIRRAKHDLRLLSEPRPPGYVPSAGIPWFSVPFGRDSLITSIQTMMLQPAIAYGSLQFLADYQGKEHDDWRDEDPGKILHEVRMGEVATLGQVPHTLYYGSVDSTPLFLITVGELFQWTNDLDFLRKLRPNIVAALTWIDQYGDLDGDGYVEFASRSPRGIRNQGWKDSSDSIVYRDGELVEPPIALSEVQAYVYGARLAAADCFRALDEPNFAEEQTDRAADLKRRFQKDFWVKEEDYIGIALGRDKRPVPAVSSNPGHCLWTGLLDDEHAHAVAARLLNEDLNCGWGIRTLSNREPMFNPMSYHNGSVWPHDNAIVAAGLKRLGYDTETARLVSDVLEAAQRFPNFRLPELYCGFARDRRYFSTPAQYPVSCSPQAWAAGAVFSMIQTLLGLRVEAARLHLTLRPRLPHWINRVSIRRLQVAGRRVDFEVCREGERQRVEIWDSGGLEIAVEPASHRPLPPRRASEPDRG